MLTASDHHLARVRTICAALPETTEKLSHDEPTFFVRKKVYTMFANNHHGDGRIAVWIPVPPGVQSMLIEAAPQKFFRPPYVGVRGWVGIVLAELDDAELELHLHAAWRQIAPKRLLGVASPGPAATDANGVGQWQASAQERALASTDAGEEGG